MRKFSFKMDKPVEKYNKSDILFLASVILLWGLGIFTLFVCSPNVAARLFNDRYYFVIRQLFWSAIGFGGLAFFALAPMTVMKKMLPFIVMGSFFLCLLVFIPNVGSRRNGAARWISIFNLFTIQPSEFAKFAVILFLANLFSKQQDEDRSEVFPTVGVMLFVGIIIFLQKDLSTGVVIFCVSFIMFIVCKAKPKLFLQFTFFIGLPFFCYFIVIEPYRLNRMIAFFHPEEFSLTAGYQEMASQRAITAGGIWGNGIGSGLTEAFKIPEVQSDYIFAAWADSMGLVGVSAFFLLEIFFFGRGMRIAFSCSDVFAAYTSFGCIMILFLQMLINCAVVSGASPTTGMPLPFFSSGGSSLFVTLCMCGFVLNSSHYDIQDEKTVSIMTEY